MRQGQAYVAHRCLHFKGVSGNDACDLLRDDLWAQKSRQTFSQRWPQLPPTPCHLDGSRALPLPLRPRARLWPSIALPGRTSGPSPHTDGRGSWHGSQLLPRESAIRPWTLSIHPSTAAHRCRYVTFVCRLVGGTWFGKPCELRLPDCAGDSHGFPARGYCFGVDRKHSQMAYDAPTQTLRVCCTSCNHKAMGAEMTAHAGLHAAVAAAQAAQ
jgi:hypothetical protein